MAFNDAFGLWGHWAFSSRKTHGRALYEAALDAQGDAYSKDFSSLEQGKQYARAIVFATVQYQLDRALNNRNPAKATDLLGRLEQDFQVTPGPNDTLPQRRSFLAALAMVSQGNSRGVIEAALSAILGSDFVSYTPGTSGSPWPSSPGTVGVFSNSVPKNLVINDAVSRLGSPISVSYSVVGESDLPISGETYTVDPDPRRSIEQITITALTSTHLTASFSKAHDPGTAAVRPYNLWASPQRLSLIVVSLAAAKDPEKRRKVNELMARATRGVSQWSIVSDQGTLNLNTTGRDLLGCTKLG